MTWHFDPTGDVMDVYDHEGTQVASNREFGTNPAGDNGHWDGEFPNGVLDVMRENMEGNQPSAYNQSLLADAATENIVEGTPP